VEASWRRRPHEEVAVHILLAVTFLCLILTLAALVATRRDLRHSRDALAHLRAYHEERNARPNVLSHELRTPLTVVQGSAELLLEESPGPLNALQREFVSTIAENSHQVIEMANDLLEEARIESEQFKRSSSNPRRPGSCQRGGCLCLSPPRGACESSTVGWGTVRMRAVHEIGERRWGSVLRSRSGRVRVLAPRT